MLLRQAGAMALCFLATTPPALRFKQSLPLFARIVATIAAFACVSKAATKTMHRAGHCRFSGSAAEQFINPAFYHFYLYPHTRDSSRLVIHAIANRISLHAGGGCYAALTIRRLVYRARLRRLLRRLCRRAGLRAADVFSAAKRDGIVADPRSLLMGGEVCL